MDPTQLSAALIELGITPGALQAIRAARPDKGKMLLDELKLIAKSRYKKLAFELHPDRTGGDAAKTAKFSFMSQVIMHVQAMEYQAPPLPPPPRPQPTPPVIRQVVFRPIPVSRPQRPQPTGSPTQCPPTVTVKGPQGLHVVFLRPT